MRWPDDLANWPMSDVSRRVLCRPHRWHIQEAGTGPTLLLLHGAGGASQSWRGVFPLLAEAYHVVAIDLPGQGFTELGARSRCGLGHMSEDIANLIVHEGWSPKAIIGHSAGGAIAIQLAQTGVCKHVIGINAALSNFRGVAGWLFPMMAKALALNPLSAKIFSATSTSASIDRLIAGTGSNISQEGKALYTRLAQDKDHVEATLAMMSQWSLEPLNARLPTTTAFVDLIVADGDKAVPPSSSVDASKALINGRIHSIRGLGHLAHEEDPDRIVRVIKSCLVDA